MSLIFMVASARTRAPREPKVEERPRFHTRLPRAHAATPRKRLRRRFSRDGGRCAAVGAWWRFVVYVKDALSGSVMRQRLFPCCQESQVRVEDKSVEQERLRASVEQDLCKALQQASGLESLTMQHEAPVWKRAV